MDDYKMGFLLLYNAITDALRVLGVKDIDTAKEILTNAQKKADEVYVEEDDGDEEEE